MRQLCVFTGLILVYFAAAFSAHPHALHPESIDRHAQLILTPGEIILIYQVVLGVNPTERAAAAMDADGDGIITEEERDAFIQHSGEQYGAAQRIRLGDHVLEPRLQVGDAYSTFGHHGISVIKIDLGFRIPIPADIPRGVTLPFEYRDERLANIPGWKQVNLQTRGVTYSGHIPYREYEPFDYVIIDTMGFYPTTNSIRGELLIPEDAALVEIETVALPERAPLETPSPYGGNAPTVIAAAVLLVLIIGAVIIKVRGQS